jgi:hypothetical protein
MNDYISTMAITFSKWKIRQEESPRIRLTPPEGAEVQPAARAPRRSLKERGRLPGPVLLLRLHERTQDSVHAA